MTKDLYKSGNETIINVINTNMSNQKFSMQHCWKFFMEILSFELRAQSGH